MYVYLNGRFLKESEAAISVFDRGFLYGDGVFETMRSYGGCIFRLDRHLQRLFRGLEALRIRIPVTAADLARAVYGLLDLNGLADAYVRLTVSRGTGGRGIDMSGCDSPTTVITAGEFVPQPEEFYLRGVKVCVSRGRRNCRPPADSPVKSLNFLNNILARQEASRRGAFEALLLNHEGYLTEGTVSNLFFVSRGVIFTPSTETGILEGITRRTVIEAAGQEGIPLEEGLFRTGDLDRADEVFLTNSLVEILPVGDVDGKIFGPGPVTRRLMLAYRRIVKRETERRNEA